MQRLQITLPTFFGIPYSEICVSEERISHLWLNFILGTKWTCLKCNIFTLSDEAKQGFRRRLKQGYSYNVFCFTQKKCLQGIFFTRKVELQRTLCSCSKVESAVLSWSWQIYFTCLTKIKKHWEQSFWNLHRMSFPVGKEWEILPAVYFK